MDIREVYDFLKKCNTYYLATVDGDQARVRPFGTAKLFEDKLYIQTGKVKNVSRQMHADPKVELCAFDGEKWLRIAATAVEDPRLEPQEALLADYPVLQANYQPGDGNNEVWYLTQAIATLYSFTEPPVSCRF